MCDLNSFVCNVPNDATAAPAFATYNMVKTCWTLGAALLLRFAGESSLMMVFPSCLGSPRSDDGSVNLTPEMQNWRRRYEALREHPILRKMPDLTIAYCLRNNSFDLK